MPMRLLSLRLLTGAASVRFSTIFGARAGGGRALDGYGYDAIKKRGAEAVLPGRDVAMNAMLTERKVSSTVGGIANTV